MMNYASAVFAPEDGTPDPERFARFMSGDALAAAGQPTPANPFAPTHMGGLYTLDPNVDVDNPGALGDLASRLSLQQRARYDNAYKPFEDALAAEIRGTGASYRSALRDMGMARDVHNGAYRRNLSRYGVALDGRSEGNAERRASLAQLAASFEDANRLRDMYDTQNTNTLGRMASSSAQMANNALSSLGSASMAAQQRQAQNDAARSASRKQIGSLFGTLLGAGVGSLVGAPTLGATIGGGLGSMVR